MAEALSAVEHCENELESTESDYSSEGSEPEHDDAEELALGALNLSRSESQADGDGVHKLTFLKVFDQLKEDPVIDSDAGQSVLELLTCIK